MHALVSIAGAASDAELAALPYHEELELRQGLVHALRVAGGWLMSEAAGGRGADALLSRVLREDPEVVCVGVSPWESVLQREALSLVAGRHVHTYNPGEPDGGGSARPLSPGVSHFVLSEGGDPSKSHAANADDLRRVADA